MRNVSIIYANTVPQALLHCPHLSTLTISDNPELETLMIWSDDLTHLDLSGCNNIINLKLHCPNLVEQKVPPLKFIEKHIKPTHPPIASMLKVWSLVLKTVLCPRVLLARSFTVPEHLGALNVVLRTLRLHLLLT